LFFLTVIAQKKRSEKKMEEEIPWEVLKFQSFSSATDVTFWQKLGSLKLNKFKLSDQSQVCLVTCNKHSAYL
jgi:hypothetical protein